MPLRKIRIGISGTAGKMGKRLVSLINQEGDFVLTFALERKGHPALGQDIGLFAGLNKSLGVLLTDGVPGKICDIILDFSSPVTIKYLLPQCVRYKIALLVGTTGYTANQVQEIREASKKIPILMAPNFSQGAGLVGELGQTIIKRWGEEADIEIIETHHRTKKDAPSGTAARLAQEIKEVLKDKKRVIPIHSLRLGQVVGEHTIVFGLPAERIEIRHLVDNRDAFAYGALKMAGILAGKPRGFYTIKGLIK